MENIKPTKASRIFLKRAKEAGLIYKNVMYNYGILKDIKYIMQLGNTGVYRTEKEIDKKIIELTKLIGRTK